MRLTWQAEDIRGGIVVGKPGRLEQFMIVYVHAEKGNKYQLVSYNADGALFGKPISAEEMATRLNDHEWPVQILGALGQLCHDEAHPPCPTELVCR